MKKFQWVVTGFFSSKLYCVKITDLLFTDMSTKGVNELVGDRIIVNCTLSKDYNDVDSSHMYFKFKNDRVPEKYITRPDSRTIQLNISASLNMSGHLYCHADNKTETLAHESVDIFSKFQNVMLMIS